MKFLVFIKQVPESNEVHFDRQKKTLIREGVRNNINAYDRRALSESIRYRNEKGGEVIAVTMGPPQAREVLAEALWMGVDRAIHIQDPRLAGSDTFVTARVLAAVARRVEYDIIFCGQHSTDSETGQVPPSLGELLGIPCATAVRKVEYGEETIRVWSETDEGTLVLELLLPAVLSAAERLIKPIKTKGMDFSSALVEKIETWDLSHLEIDPQTVGLQGSPTWVADIVEERSSRKKEILQSVDLEPVGYRILQEIQSKTIRPSHPELPQPPRWGNRDYWCFVEFYQGTVRPVSLEILATAASLAARSGGRVSAVHLGHALNREEIAVLSSWGADQIYQAISSTLHPDDVVACLCERISVLHPYAVFFPSTSYGRYLAPRIAARLGIGLTGDCIGLRLDMEGRLQQMKPAFGGNIVAPIYSKTFPQMATIRPGALPSYKPRVVAPASVISWNYPYNVAHQLTILSRETDAGVEAARMENCRILICIGMGLGEENCDVAFHLADLLKGAVGATRRVVDAGWLPRQFQVGLTGKFVAPDVYLGLGVSGRVNHTIGIQKAGTILAINHDPAAEIFQQCDLGILADAPSVTKKLIQLLEDQ